MRRRARRSRRGPASRKLARCSSSRRSTRARAAAFRASDHDVARSGAEDRDPGRKVHDGILARRAGPALERGADAGRDHRSVLSRRSRGQQRASSGSSMASTTRAISAACRSMLTINPSCGLSVGQVVRILELAQHPRSAAAHLRAATGSVRSSRARCATVIACRRKPNGLGPRALPASRRRLVYPWGEELPPPDRSGTYADLAAAKILPTTLVTYTDGFEVDGAERQLCAERRRSCTISAATSRNGFKISMRSRRYEPGAAAGRSAGARDGPVPCRARLELAQRDGTDAAPRVPRLRRRWPRGSGFSDRAQSGMILPLACLSSRSCHRRGVTR